MGAVSLTGLTGAGTNTPRLLVTEIDLSSDGIELENVTALPLDLTGWNVYFYDWTTWPSPVQAFSFPPGTVAPPAGVMTIRDTGTAPGSYPSFYTIQAISWFNEATDNPVAVLLVDPAGQPADFFCAVDAYPTNIANPLPIPASQWSGNPVDPNIVPTLTYQRTNSVDLNSAPDWAVLTASMGAANAGLSGPFSGPRLVSISPIVTASFSSGIWSGTVSVNESITNMYLLAQDADGHAGAGGWFAVQPSTDLAVRQTASPASPVLGQDLTFTLLITNSGPAAAQSVSLVSPLPPTVTYKSSTSTQGAISISGSTVTATVGAMAAGAQVTVTIVATATASGGATNSATVSTSTVDYQPANNSAAAGAWINYVPSITSTANQFTYEDSAPVTVAFTISDIETPAGSLGLSASSSNTGLVPAGNLVFGGSGASRTLTMTPLANQFGSTLITIFVADSQNTSSNQFILAVTSVNDPPSFVKGGNQTVLEDAGPRTVAGWATAISPGPANEAAQTVAFNVGNNNPALFALAPAVSPAGALTYTTATNAVGSATVTLTLQDNGGTANGGVDTSAPQSFTITVTPVNDPPTFTKGLEVVVNEDCGPTNITTWATGISPGPSDESSQTVSFLVSNGNNALFSTQPALTPSGTLSFTPATNANGSAAVTVRFRITGEPLTGDWIPVSPKPSISR